ncbi:hypothetical protein BJX99DRAFT_263130 [Aspergillus californicus]
MAKSQLRYNEFANQLELPFVSRLLKMNYLSIPLTQRFRPEETDLNQERFSWKTTSYLAPGEDTALEDLATIPCSHEYCGATAAHVRSKSLIYGMSNDVIYGVHFSTVMDRSHSAPDLSSGLPRSNPRFHRDAVIARLRVGLVGQQQHNGLEKNLSTMLSMISWPRFERKNSPRHSPFDVRLNTNSLGVNIMRLHPLYSIPLLGRYNPHSIRTPPTWPQDAWEFMQASEADRKG